MKKVLSLVLVIAMVLSSMSFAFAGTFADVTGDYEDAVNALVALGVVKGYEDGTFRPERIITRAELAKILVEALGYGKLVAGATNNFSDTQGHWASGYVTIAAGTGLVLGYPDGTFGPDKAVTYDEAYTMVIRALGYTDNVLKGTWPTNFKVKAIDLGLDDGVEMATVGADRGGVAQILYNALELPMVEIDEDGIVVKVEPEKLLIDNIATPGTLTVSKDTINSKHDDYAGDKVDLEPYMYQSIDVYYNDDDEVVYVKDVNSTVIEGTVDEVTVEDDGDVVVDIEEADEDIEEVTVNDDSDTTVNSVVSVSVYENGRTKTNKTYTQLLGTETIKAVYTDTDYDAADPYDSKDEVLVGFIVTQQTHVAKVENEYLAGKDYVDEFDLPVDDEDDVDFDKVTVKGAVDSVEDIKENDVVVEYAAFDGSAVVETLLVVSRETVEGKISRVDDMDTVDATDDEYYISGTAYTANGDTFALGNNGVFYLDHNGEIVAFEGESNEPTDYAVILDLSDGSTKLDRYGKESIDELPQLKLATQDNEVVYLDIYVDIDFNNDSEDVIESQDDYVVLVALDDEDTVADESDSEDPAYGDAGYTIDITGLGKDYLIKYSLNADEEIEEISVTANSTQIANYGGVDLDKASDKLADNVVVFNSKAEDYEIVNVEKLPTTFNAYEHRNTQGLIDVLVLEDGELAAEELTFAYITKANQAWDDADDEIAYVKGYIYDDELGYYTTTDLVKSDFVVGNVYAVTFDGEVVDSADDVTTSTAVKASDINFRSELLEIGGTWYSLAEDATVVIINEDNTTELGDLVDIDENATLFTFYETVDADDVIGLIVIDLGAQGE